MTSATNSIESDRRFRGSYAFVMATRFRRPRGAPITLTFRSAVAKRLVFLCESHHSGSFVMPARAGTDAFASSVPTLQSGWQASARAQAFLNDNPDLVSLLDEAHEQLIAHFGGNAQYILRVYDDPDGGSPELHGLVYTRLASEEALRRLDAFDESWWLDNLHRAHGRLVLSLKHV